MPQLALDRPKTIVISPQTQSTELQFFGHVTAKILIKSVVDMVDSWSWTGPNKATPSLKPSEPSLGGPNGLNRRC